MRDNDWLRRRLDIIWFSSFKDIDRKNKINVLFKGKWKNKFGHIKKREDKTEIVVNGLFKDLRVPEFIIDLTIAHELVHYMHGFQSPYERQFKYPHQGGIVKKELKKRGYGALLIDEKEWTKNNWLELCKEYFPKKSRRRFGFF